jgi:hypothetical protein
MERRERERVKKVNPDENIIDFCLAMQFCARAHGVGQKNFIGSRILRDLYKNESSTWNRSVPLNAFMKYHIRRLSGDVDGPGSDDLLLCTYDKELSLHADAMGIYTFPLFNRATSRCTRADSRPCDDRGTTSSP